MSIRLKNFNDYKYERIDYESTKNKINNLFKKLIKCNDKDSYINIVKKLFKIERHIEEMCDYADIRNMRELDNQFYKDEMDYWNSYKNKFDSLFIPFYNELLNSKYKDDLNDLVPSNFFKIIDYQSKTTSDEISDLVKKENELKLAHRNLNKTPIMYKNEEMSLLSINHWCSNKDRKVRKNAHDAINDFYYEHRNEYDDILFNLINIRNEIAKKLGFKNYVEYSLYRRKRFDYDYNDIRKFRESVIKYINPICEMMSEWQKEELKVDELMYYDSIFFKEMPKVKIIGNKLLNKLKSSFKKTDNDLYNLYKNMLNKGYIDLAQSENKATFNITNYLAETGVPVITGNFKNNYVDIKTATHEMGHSFQKYNASIKDKDYIISSLLKYPAMEVAEMFSYAMELIMMKQVENLFNKKEYKKFCFMKMHSLISNLPYMCLVDEFQEEIYSNEHLKVEDIRKTWSKLTKKYQLEKSNSGHINLDEGGSFYKTSHIYIDPFYYIDYALSYVGAFSIWNKCNNDLSFFKEIGSIASYYSFKDLINNYNMPNPFDDKTIEKISNTLKEELLKYKVD